MATKKQAKDSKAKWQLALSQGRVVRRGNMTMTSYPTVEQARIAVAIAKECGLEAEIIAPTDLPNA